MRVLVTGANGQLGYDVIKALSEQNIDCKGVDYADFDIADKAATQIAIQSYNPTAIIHCAAYTAVDKAEDEPEMCRKINEDGTKNIAEACKLVDAKMIYISTDYVFSGEGEYFYKPYDPTKPISVYGKTKLAGEKAVQETLEKYFIVRISWVFGKNGNNFVKTMLRLGKERDSINVVCDQIGSPTYTADIALLLCDMIQTNKYGIYHATNEGTCSWAEFAQEIFNLSNMNTIVIPIPTADYITRAVRPMNSRMDKTCLDNAQLPKLPHWKDSLRKFFN